MEYKLTEIVAANRYFFTGSHDGFANADIVYTSENDKHLGP